MSHIQGMLARWLAKLQQFHFDIIHRPGAQHGNADGLSSMRERDMHIGSSLDSELIPLESGETCVAAVMITQSENSKLITTA